MNAQPDTEKIPDCTATAAQSTKSESDANNIARDLIRRGAEVSIVFDGESFKVWGEYSNAN